MDVKLSLSNTEHKELISYCNLNDLLVSSVVKESFTTGFNIERYGLLGDSPKGVIKEVEVIKEVPVEKVVTKIEYISDNTKIDELLLKIQQLEERKPELVEVKVVEYVDRELIREVPVEKIVEKIVNIYDNSYTDELVGKTEQLKKENELFSTKVEELNCQIEKFSTKTTEMEIFFQNEKNELLLKIQQLEENKPEVIEKVVGDETKQRMLEQTLQTLRTENFSKDKKIKELEDIVSDCRKYEQKMGAVYLRGTNLDETLFK
jgi:hypothetical protein